MSYTPTQWQTGDTITAEKLNNMESGIEAANDGDVFEVVATGAGNPHELTFTFSQTAADTWAAIQAGKVVNLYVKAVSDVMYPTMYKRNVENTSAVFIVISGSPASGCGYEFTLTSSAWSYSQPNSKDSYFILPRVKNADLSSIGGRYFVPFFETTLSSGFSSDLAPISESIDFHDTLMTALDGIANYAEINSGEFCGVVEVTDAQTLAYMEQELKNVQFAAECGRPVSVLMNRSTEYHSYGMMRHFAVIGSPEGFEMSFTWDKVVESSGTFSFAIFDIIMRLYYKVGETVLEPESAVFIANCTIKPATPLS